MIEAAVIASRLIGMAACSIAAVAILEGRGAAHPHLVIGTVTSGLSALILPSLI
jgi:hypothetical protein